MYLEKPDDDFLSKNRNNRKSREATKGTWQSGKIGTKEPLIEPVEELNEKPFSGKAVLTGFFGVFLVLIISGIATGGISYINKFTDNFFDYLVFPAGNIGASSTSATNAANTGDSGASSSSSRMSDAEISAIEESVNKIGLKSDLYIVRNNDDSFDALVCLYYHPQADFLEKNYYNFESFLLVKNGSKYEFDDNYCSALDYYNFYYTAGSASVKNIISNNQSNENPYKISVSGVEKSFKTSADKNYCVVMTAGSNGVSQLYNGNIAKAFENVSVKEVKYSEMDEIIKGWNATYALADGA